MRDVVAERIEVDQCAKARLGRGRCAANSQAEPAVWLLCRRDAIRLDQP